MANLLPFAMVNQICRREGIPRRESRSTSVGINREFLQHIVSDFNGNTGWVDSDVRRKLLESIPADAKICGLFTKGEYGLILGGATDRVAFPYYAEAGTWAPQAVSLLNSSFDGRGGTYLDIGANIGLTIIPVARNPAVTCLVFEPEPANYERLSTNIALNCVNGNIKLFNVALFDRIEKLCFELSPDNLGDNRIRTRSTEVGQFKEENWKTIEVDAVPLDEIVGEATMPIAAKIDTQGAEPFVIAGGRRLLERADLLLLEFWPYGMVRMGGDPKIVIDFLRSNFSYGAIQEGDKEGELIDMPIDELADRLSAIAREETDGRRYFDVTVRKSSE